MDDRRWKVKRALPHTVEAHGDILGRNDLHRNRLLISRQLQVLGADSAPPSPPSALLAIFLLFVARVIFPRFVREDGVEFATRG
jgi:hypothetical protein